MRTAVLAFLLVAPLALRAEVWTGSADVRFKGYSTLHNFEGTVSDVPLRVSVSGSKGARVVSATSNVEVTRMSTKEADRDKGMWKMFDAAKNKFINVQVNNAAESALRPTRKQGREVPGSMQIVLTLAGTKGTVAGTVTALKEADDQVSFDLAFSVSLKAFALKPPAAAFGLVSVSDNVDVTAHITLRRKGD
jgi:YceI-like domain